MLLSHLVWGVWIEIRDEQSANAEIPIVTPRMRCVDWNNNRPPEICRVDRHTSYEVCGLKYTRIVWVLLTVTCHTSYEVCGLKFEDNLQCISRNRSHLVWGVWIEIQKEDTFLLRREAVTPRMRCVDWNGGADVNLNFSYQSHLVWGVWIEICRLSGIRPLLPRHTSYEVCGLK